MNPFLLGLAAAATALAVTGTSATPSLTPRAGPGAHQSQPRTPAAQWPVQPPTVVRGFVPHERYGPGHRGTDLTATPGQLVRSALPGVVTFAGQVAGRGVVVVRHRGNLRTTYLPVRPARAVGDQVEAGSPLGRLAPSAHCPLSFCLHWGARRGETYVDPLGLLPAGVVLLP